jgi:hypothetical protein
MRPPDNKKSNCPKDLAIERVVVSTKSMIRAYTSTGRQREGG